MANGRMDFPLIVLKDGRRVSGNGDRAVRRHCIDSRAVEPVGGDQERRRAPVCAFRWIWCRPGIT